MTEILEIPLDHSIITPSDVIVATLKGRIENKEQQEAFDVFAKKLVIIRSVSIKIVTTKHRLHELQRLKQSRNCHRACSNGHQFLSAGSSTRPAPWLRLVCRGSESQLQHHEDLFLDEFVVLMQ